MYPVIHHGVNIQVFEKEEIPRCACTQESHSPNGLAAPVSQDHGSMRSGEFE